MFFKGSARCPVCKNSTALGAYSVISPWIRELGIRSRFSKYFICGNCQTGFFDKRYTDNEMADIYREYRGSEYLKKRSKWEPWYTNLYNSNHDSDQWIESRKKSLTEFLSRANINECNIVVDVGGDRGQYIPDIALSKIVIDISDKELCDNVARLNRIGDLPFADLVIYAHVLEHVSNPIHELQMIFQKTNQIYVEVPFGIPEINKYRRSLGRFVLYLLSSMTPKLWTRNACPATGRKVAPKKMLTQSEHLTFFSERSMERIAQVLGLNLLIERNTISTPDFSEGIVLQCLLSKRLGAD